MGSLREDAEKIIAQAIQIQSVLPDQAVEQALQKALQKKEFCKGNIYVVAAGKAAWQMANAACGLLGDHMKQGVVITKYHHVKGDIPGETCYEGGHPVPDENSFTGTQAALELVDGLIKTGATGTNVNDVAVLLISQCVS